MSTVNCPHCQQGVENRADLSEQVVSCPHCRRQFQMPAYSHLVVPQAMPLSAVQQQPQVLVLNAVPKQRARLKPKGWASNTLAVAGVFFVCAMLFVFATCGGLYYWMKSEVRGNLKAAGDSIVGTDAEREDARKRARVVLKPYGIRSIATNATSVRTDSGATISGAGLDARGETHRFFVYFEINDFGDTEKWEPKSITVDGREMLGGDQSEPVVIRPPLD